MAEKTTWAFRKLRDVALVPVVTLAMSLPQVAWSETLAQKKRPSMLKTLIIST